MSVEEDRYILTRDYANKYGLDKRKIAPACRADALIAERRNIPDPERKGSTTARWFILDIPPLDHPKWQEYQDKLMKGVSYQKGKSYEKNFDEWAPIFLERYDKARNNLDQTNFRVSELAKMINTQPDIVRKWTEVGVEGYGKLPKIIFSDDKKAIKDKDTNLYESRYGRLEYYYANKDIRRFFKKELVNPNVKFRTIDDATTENNTDEIVRGHNHYVYDTNKVSPMTYDGFMKWVGDNVWIRNKKTRRKEIFIPTGRQRQFFKKVFELKRDGTFKYRFVCLSYPRGEGKSLMVVLLILFRFFNLPEEQIFLVANSEKQTTHVLFNEAKKIINDSPTLQNIMGIDVLQKGIFLMAGNKETYASIEVMSVESGARSNATCFAFSEIHKLTDEANFAEIYGSIRAITNAWVLMESTVAPKGHVFHRLFERYQEGKDPLLYFDHYSDEHYNPDMTKEELESYEAVFLPGDYARFFRNRWEDAATGLFDESRILEMGAIGIDGTIGPSRELKDAINRIVELKRLIKNLSGATNTSAQQAELFSLQARIRWIDDLYKLPATAEDIDKISSLMKCDLIIGIGIDRARHVAKKSDRTAVVTTAKAIIDENTWMAFVLDIFLPAEGDDDQIKERIMRASEQYGYVAQIDVEEYQGKDLEKWCNLYGFPAILVSATYKRQEAMFPLLYMQMRQGLYKCPAVPAWADEDERLYDELPPEGIMDLYRTELGAFEHIPPKNEKKVGRFGSSFKHATESRRTRKGEPKDDTVYAAAHSLMAANAGDISINYGKGTGFASAIINEKVLGDYS